MGERLSERQDVTEQRGAGQDALEMKDSFFRSLEDVRVPWGGSTVEDDEARGSEPELVWLGGSHLLRRVLNLKQRPERRGTESRLELW